MPIRIKPKIDLKPCKINLNGLNGIVERVYNDFPNATFSATDYIWEIYDETKDTFLAEVVNRKVLELFYHQSSSKFPNSSTRQKRI